MRGNEGKKGKSRGGRVAQAAAVARHVGAVGRPDRDGRGQGAGAAALEEAYLCHAAFPAGPLLCCKPPTDPTMGLGNPSLAAHGQRPLVLPPTRGVGVVEARVAGGGDDVVQFVCCTRGARQREPQGHLVPQLSDGHLAYHAASARAGACQNEAPAGASPWCALVRSWPPCQPCAAPRWPARWRARPPRPARCARRARCALTRQAEVGHVLKGAVGVLDVHLVVL